MKTDHERHAEDLAAYSLGALGPLEATAVERHLMRCEICARDLERLRYVVDGLPATVPDYRASPQLKKKVMADVRKHPIEASNEGDPSRTLRLRCWLLPRRPTLALAGGLACMVLIAGAYGVGAATSGSQQQIITATVDRTQLPEARAVLAAEGAVGVLRASQMPELSGSEVYVVWVDRGDGPIYESSFNVQPDGTGQAGISDVDGVQRVMVTREGSTAVAHPTESPVVTAQLG